MWIGNSWAWAVLIHGHGLTVPLKTLRRVHSLSSLHQMQASRAEACSIQPLSQEGRAKSVCGWPALSALLPLTAMLVPRLTSFQKKSMAILQGGSELGGGGDGCLRLLL